MAKSKLPKSYLTAIKNIGAKGFSHIKVELEANLGRGEINADCERCTSGHLVCATCGGAGYNLARNNAHECVPCGGEGRFECAHCGGRGRTRRVGTEWCERFLQRYMGKEAREALVFGKFYDDRSVDSEYTFTLPIEKAHLSLDIMRAFIKLGESLNGLDIHNAGMHISVLPSGVYPCPPHLLNASYMENFRTEVTKLLPALYFLSTHNGLTRGVDFRKPKISHNSKYSAIFTHGDTCLEYRLFDTCYDKPEALLEKIEIIAQTLKYYSHEKVKVNYNKFIFPASANDRDQTDICQFFANVHTYDAMNRTVKYLKPAKSLKRLKAEREVSYTHPGLSAKFKAHLARCSQDYDTYRRMMEDRKNESIYGFFNQINYYMASQNWDRVAYHLSNTDLGYDKSTARRLWANKVAALAWIEANIRHLDLGVDPPLELYDYALAALGATSDYIIPAQQ